MYFEYAMLAGFFVTLATEIPTILIIQKPKRFVYWSFVIFLTNSITHPIFQIALRVFDMPYLLLELIVIFLEACIFYLVFDITKKRALIIATVANLVSILVGFLIWSVFINLISV